jgi:hypothetical protein
MYALILEATWANATTASRSGRQLHVGLLLGLVSDAASADDVGLLTYDLRCMRCSLWCEVGWEVGRMLCSRDRGGERWDVAEPDPRESCEAEAKAELTQVGTGLRFIKKKSTNPVWNHK